MKYTLLALLPLLAFACSDDDTPGPGVDDSNQDASAADAGNGGDASSDEDADAASPLEDAGADAGRQLAADAPRAVYFTSSSPDSATTQRALTRLDLATGELTLLGAERVSTLYAGDNHLAYTIRDDQNQLRVHRLDYQTQTTELVLEGDADALTIVAVEPDGKLVNQRRVVTDGVATDSIYRDDTLVFAAPHRLHVQSLAGGALAWQRPQIDLPNPSQATYSVLLAGQTTPFTLRALYEAIGPRISPDGRCAAGFVAVRCLDDDAQSVLPAPANGGQVHDVIWHPSKPALLRHAGDEVEVFERDATGWSLTRTHELEPGSGSGLYGDRWFSGACTFSLGGDAWQDDFFCNDVPDLEGDAGTRYYLPRLVDVRAGQRLFMDRYVGYTLSAIDQAAPLSPTLLWSALGFGEPAPNDYKSGSLSPAADHFLLTRNEDCRMLAVGSDSSPFKLDATCTASVWLNETEALVRLDNLTLQFLTPTAAIQVPRAHVMSFIAH